MKFNFKPEEFIVEEITLEGKVLKLKKWNSKTTFRKSKEADFCRFVLQKQSWNTTQAIRAISDQLQISSKRFNFAGTKDRNATTTQLVSCFKLNCKEMKKVQVKDVQINECYYSSEKAGIGSLAGNRFTIILNKENCGIDPDVKEITKKANAAKLLIRNFFGEQRFGSVRRNTHLVGLELLKGNIQNAVLDYITFSDENEKDEETKAARFKLLTELQNKDNINVVERRVEGVTVVKERIKVEVFRDALAYFPKYLKFERTLIGELAKIPTDFMGAFRRMPRELQLMFVHAVQSFIFNEILNERTEQLVVGDFVCLKNELGFPNIEGKIEVSNDNLKELQEKVDLHEAFVMGKLVGYESTVSEHEQRVLERLGISKEMFKIKSLPELSSKGTLRPAFIALKNFKARKVKTGVQVQFELQSGSYATVAIEQLL